MHTAIKLAIKTIAILFSALYSAIVVSASSTAQSTPLPIPQNAEAVCAANGELVYTVTDTSYRQYFYRYSPRTLKTTLLGSVNDVARYSGDYLVLSDRFLLTCVSVDKRVTKDLKIKQNPEETMRLICIDLKNNITNELTRFQSSSDLIHLEAVDSDSLLLYGRVKQAAGIATSYVDFFNIETKTWESSVAIKQQRIGGATCDNKTIYILSENCGSEWPVQWDETQKPIYTLSSYDLNGKLLNEETLDFDSLFPKEKNRSFYKSFNTLSVSNNYVKLDDFGSESALFLLKSGSIVPIYSGSRLTCWDNAGREIKADPVYFHALDGVDYFLNKNTGLLTPILQDDKAASQVVGKYWDGKSDFIICASLLEGSSNLQYTIAPIPQ